MKDKLRAGVIGLGLIGKSHIDAIRRIGVAELYALADVNSQAVDQMAKSNFINKTYTSIDEIINDPEIDVIHNCTPNNMHAYVNSLAIRSGKHIFSEKPLTRTSDEARELVNLLKKHPDICAGVNFNYRMNPLIQDIRSKIQKGYIGIPTLVHGSYLQDWALWETDYNWRMESALGGISRTVADIGVHWMDLIQTVTNSKIVEVCADLHTTIPIRKKRVEDGLISIEVDTEDFGGILFKMDNNVRGTLCVSCVSAGHGCYIQFEINGTKRSIAWNQEQCDQMWIGNRDGDNHIVLRDPSNIASDDAGYTINPKGHPEGWNDAFRNNIQSFYQFIIDGKKTSSHPSDFATFEEACDIIKITEAIVKSSKERAWVRVFD
jgi:predicted dehydrogenase